MDAEATFDDLDLQSVAVIGASIRAPGAVTLDQFWTNLAGGVESIAQFSNEQLRAAGVEADALKESAFVKAGARAPGVEDFDAEFFEMTPREAQITDPQHRVLLECSHEAMEIAGYVPQRYPGAIALFAGVGLNTYLLNNLMPRQDLIRSLGMHQLLLGNDKSYAISRIGYKLNLRGPCVCVDTACSTSLVAIAMAYKSLIAYECDMALAGAAKINAADNGYFYEAGSINSPDGHCRAFDAGARGTVFGSGAGVVLLKRLEDAVRDRDCILGIIRSAAVNSDGSTKVGFTAPSVTRQRDVVVQALRFSQIPPDSISYIEAHGTGTQLGDPIEMQALTEAFAGVERGQRCAIGSVKTNIGHLENAAGVAGLIKVIQALRHRQIPPSLNFNEPNPAIDFERGPFRVNTRLSAWPPRGEARRAGVSSFGLGGTNAHVIVEEAPVLGPVAPEAWPQLLLLSAKTPSALNAATLRLAAHLESNEGLALADVAFTLAVGRAEHTYKRFVVCNSREAAISALRASVSEASIQSASHAAASTLQAKSSALYGSSVSFRAAVDEVSRLNQEQGNIDLIALDASSDESMVEQVLRTLGELWKRGSGVDWNAVFEGSHRRRVILPTYPFEKRRHWIEPNSAMHTQATKAVQAPPAPVLHSTAAVGGARNETEESIATVWRELLGIQDVGVDQNFFELGGDSLLGTRMLAQVNEITGIQLPLQKLFDGPTIEELAVALLAARLEEADPERVEALLAQMDESSLSGVA